MNINFVPIDELYKISVSLPKKYYTNGKTIPQSGECFTISVKSEVVESSTLEQTLDILVGKIKYKLQDYFMSPEVIAKMDDYLMTTGSIEPPPIKLCDNMNVPVKIHCNTKSGETQIFLEMDIYGRYKVITSLEMTIQQ